jgi:hypothetical protein
VRVPFRLKLATGQINGLSSFIEKTVDKREYRRAVAVFQNGAISELLTTHRIL